MADTMTKRALFPSMRRATAPSPLAALALALVGGCGGTGPTVHTNGPVTARQLYPMAAGYVWTYDVDTATDTGPSLAVTRVVGMVEGTATVADTMGREHAYELREGGLYRVNDDVWLLREPIVVGTEWPSVNGRTARITSVTEVVDVVAGHYEGCVEVREEGGDTERAIRTIYCPGVGPALVELHQTLSTSMTGGVTVTGRLRDFQNGLDDWTREE